MSMCRSSLENVTYEFVFTSSSVPSSSFLDGVCEVGGKWSFSPNVSSESKWCNHRVVLTRLQLGRIPFFILSEKSDFYVVDNLSIVVYALPMLILTLLSVDEILLPMYMNWSTNFRGLPFNEKIALS